MTTASATEGQWQCVDQLRRGVGPQCQRLELELERKFNVDLYSNWWGVGRDGALGSRRHTVSTMTTTIYLPSVAGHLTEPTYFVFRRRLCGDRRNVTSMDRRTCRRTGQQVPLVGHARRLFRRVDGAFNVAKISCPWKEAVGALQVRRTPILEMIKLN